jgi:SAM-dependent methyltransferase
VDVVPPSPGAPLEGREVRRLLDQIQAEIATPSGPETVVAWRGRHRWIEVWEELPAAPEWSRGSREGSWLVAGDAEEPGHDLARVLAARPGTKVALLGTESSWWEGLDSWMDEIARRVTAEVPAGGAGLVDRATDALCTSYAIAALRVPRVAPGQERLHRALLRMLREDGLAELPGPDEIRRVRESEAPQLRGLFDLLDHCGRHLAEVLAGEIPGLSVLYPEGSPDLLARAIEAAESEGPPDVAPLLLRELLQIVQERRPGRPLRILEVGAGQGTLTREVLPVLGVGAEYWFTDVGRAFVLAAEEKHKGAEGLRFAVLDITRDPAGQGFPLGYFDAVLGANVVHATPRIAETLGHLRALLAPGGLVALMETVRRHRWADLVWGLTPGWWSFADAPLRTESPLLDPASWEEVLGRSGFQGVRAWPQGEAFLQDMETALLLARKSATVERPLDASRIVYLTRNPAVQPALAAKTDEHIRRTDGFATVLLREEGAAAEDLAIALDRAVDAGLLQVAVSRGASPSIATPVQSPVEVETPREVDPRVALHGRPQLMTAYVAPRSDEERAIAEIWQRALGIERVGVHDNFLELGGDSLIGLQVVSAIRQRFPGQTAGGGLSLYEHSTVAAIARFVADAGTVASEDTDPFELRSSRGARRRQKTESRMNR